MRSRPLSDCKRGACRHTHCGVEVNDSARVFLLLLDMFEDERINAGEHLTVAEAMLDPSGPCDVAEVLWDAFGIDATGTRGSGPKVFDWREDAGRIRSSLRMVYGIDWDEVGGTTAFSDVCDLLYGITEAGCESPFKEALYYRTAEPPVEVKGNSAYCEAWHANREHYQLSGMPLEYDESDPYGDELLRRLSTHG